MKNFLAVCLVIVLSFFAVSCSSDTEQKTTQKTTKPEFEVVFVYNNEKSFANRIYIETNFPEGTLFDAELKKGADFSRVQPEISVQVEQAASMNYLQTDNFAVDGETIPDGDYILSISLVDIEDQPQNVQNILGKDGKLMYGQDVYAVTTIAGGTTAYEKETFSKVYRVTKVGDKYSYNEQ